MRQTNKKPAMILGAASALIIVIAAVLYFQADNRPFNWLNLKKAKAKASRENKPVFLNFYSKWSQLSKNIEKTIFMNDSIQSVLNKDYVLASINIAEKENLKMMQEVFKINNIPTYLILDENGREMKRFAAPPSNEFKFYDWLKDTSFYFAMGWKDYEEAKKTAEENEMAMLTVIVRFQNAAGSIHRMLNDEELRTAIVKNAVPFYLTTTYKEDKKYIKEIEDSASSNNSLILFDKDFNKRLSFDFIAADKDMKERMLEWLGR